MKTYWIIGGGQFGLKAAQKIRTQESDAVILIVDENFAICQQLEKRGFETLYGEGIQYLTQNLINEDYPDWIIPAIPLHVAFEWIRGKLTAKYETEVISVSDELESQLPHPIRGDKGQLYVSNADFVCPDDCSEPEEICTYTGEPRPRILNAFLENIHYQDFKSVVICSRQLFPGVGGYTPKALFQALEMIKDEVKPVILSTACYCHGVVHLFRIFPRT
ncbi:MAG: NAD-binding protein [Desulfobacterales bacterium]|jgi:hypothetical protein